MSCSFDLHYLRTSLRCIGVGMHQAGLILMGYPIYLSDWVIHMVTHLLPKCGRTSVAIRAKTK